MLNYPHINGKNTEYVMLFLHGLGSNGDDLLSLASFFGEHYNNISFVSPNAPNAFHGMGGAYQWFPIIDFTIEEMAQGCKAAYPQFVHIIDTIKTHYNITEQQIILCGFSQGTMLSLYSALTHPAPFKMVLGFSGLLVPMQQYQHAGKTPIYLAHGKQDGVVPYQATLQSHETLHKHGFTVEYDIDEQSEHSISMGSLQKAVQFLQNYL